MRLPHRLEPQIVVVPAVRESHAADQPVPPATRGEPPAGEPPGIEPQLAGIEDRREAGRGRDREGEWPVGRGRRHVSRLKVAGPVALEHPVHAKLHVRRAEHEGRSLWERREAEQHQVRRVFPLERAHAGVAPEPVPRSREVNARRGATTPRSQSSGAPAARAVASAAAVMLPPDTDEMVSSLEMTPSSFRRRSAPRWKSVARNPPPERHRPTPERASASAPGVMP